MTGLELYAIIKFWGPLLTGFGLALQAYRSVRKGITSWVTEWEVDAKAWADRLLDNHMHGIEEASKRAAEATADLAACSKDSCANIGRMCASMSAISQDFRQHCEDDRLNQAVLIEKLAAIDKQL